jgi:hypothetical protein
VRGGGVGSSTVGQRISGDKSGLEFDDQFKRKDFLLKECEFEAKGTHSVDEMIRLVEVHTGEEHRTPQAPAGDD